MQAIAAQSLADNAGISLTQAYNQLTIQDRAAPLLDDLESALGSASGSVWFDWQHGGRIKIPVVSSTNPPSGPNVDAAKQILAANGLLADADFVQVAYSITDLEAGQAAIDQLLAPLVNAGVVSTDSDPESNSVVIQTASAITPEQNALVQQAVSLSAVPVTLTASGAASLLVQPELCGYHDVRYDNVGNWVTCDPSLRGGAALDSTIYGGDCTIGFNGRLTAPVVIPGRPRITERVGQPVVVTAGHCIYNAVASAFRLPGFPTQPWYSYDGSGTRKLIGQPTYDLDFRPAFLAPLGGGDWGWIADTNNGYWAPRSFIFADRPNSTSVYRYRYYIKNDAAAHKGLTLCMTSGQPLSSPNTGPGVPDPSANYHTACGQVDHFNPQYCEAVDLVDAGGGGAAQACPTNLVETNIRSTTSGSSGGPYYKAHLAYGIHVGSLSKMNHDSVYEAIRYAERKGNFVVGGF